jgi:hypothetical protein
MCTWAVNGMQLAVPQLKLPPVMRQPGEIAWSSTELAGPQTQLIE